MAGVKKSNPIVGMTRYTQGFFSVKSHTQKNCIDGILVGHLIEYATPVSQTGNFHVPKPDASNAVCSKKRDQRLLMNFIGLQALRLNLLPAIIAGIVISGR